MEQKWSGKSQIFRKRAENEVQNQKAAESKVAESRAAETNSRIKKVAEMRRRITGSSSLEADGISGVSEEKPVTNGASLVSLKRPGNGSLVLPTNHCFCLIISL